MSDDRIVQLEEKYTHLQRHVTEQDKVILDLSSDLDRLKRELAQLRERVTSFPAADPTADSERPPHY